MIIACRHPNGLSCGGVVLRGSAVPDPSEATGRPGAGMYHPDGEHWMMGYALTRPIGEYQKQQFLAWATTNIDSSMVREGLVVWADTEEDLRRKIYVGRRTGDFDVNVSIPGHSF